VRSSPEPRFPSIYIDFLIAQRKKHHSTSAKDQKPKGNLALSPSSQAFNLVAKDIATLHFMLLGIPVLPPLFQRSFSGKTVVVTGNTGFKGSWLCLWLQKLGAKVVGIADEVPTEPSLYKLADLESLIEQHWIDVENLPELKSVIGDTQPNAVFHLAAQAIVSTSYENPVKTFSTNVMGTVHVLEAMRQLKKGVGVIITSDKCYDNVEWPWGYRENDPLGGKDIYSGSKGAAELAFKSYFHSFFRDTSGVRLATGRAGNVIGGGDWAKDRIVVDCISSWHQGSAVAIRQPKATRPWQHVLEPLSGYLTLATSLMDDQKAHGQSYNFGPEASQNRPVEDLLIDLAKAWGFDDPSQSYEITSPPSEWTEARLLKLNCDKALHDLAWMPTLQYEDVVRMTSEWYRNWHDGKVSDIRKFTDSQIEEYESVAQKRGRTWAS